MGVCIGFRRHLLTTFVCLVGAGFIFWSATPVSGVSVPQKKMQQKSHAVEVVPGVIVIKMKGGPSLPTGVLRKSGERAVQLLSAAGVTSAQRAFPVAHALPATEAAEGKVDVSLIYFGRIRESLNPVDVARQLDKTGSFEYVEPKYISRIFDTPNDPEFNPNQNAYFARMNAVSGWVFAKGDTNVVIADVDGGTYWRHPDLVPNVWINSAEDNNHNRKFDPTSSATGGDDDGIDNDQNGFVDDVIGWNFANNSNDPTGLAQTPGSGAHGTATASMFGAATNNGLGMAGSGWNCRMMLVNASAPASDESIQFGFEGIQYAYANGAKVINCSWGHPGSASRFEQDIIDAATQAGALVVSAAGNDGHNSDEIPQYPANYRNVLAVGATVGITDSRASFSNYGLTVPVYAPGVNIWGALTTGNDDNVGSGTSYASPLVAGLAGLVQSLHPLWNPQQIATQIRVTSDSVDPLMGHGRVNFGRALSETHAGVGVSSASLSSSSGETLFLPGDTVALRVTVRNVLFTDAAGLTFSASANDAALQPLQVTTAPTTLAAGDSLHLTPFLFLVGNVTQSKSVMVRLDWVSNTNERDAYAFRVDVFPTLPSWESIQSPTLTPLFSVAGVDGKTAWAAGGNTQGTSPVVIRTVDSGLTWGDETGSLVHDSVDLYCVSAVDSDRAWVGSGDGRIFATTDGGSTWSEQAYPSPPSPFMDGIRMFPDLNGYALGDPSASGKFVVLKTTDGGTHWTHLGNEPVAIGSEAGWNNSFTWTDKLHGWFGTNNSRIWRTTDGGNSWSYGQTLSQSSICVSFGDNLHGVAGFADGNVAFTGNGGSTWGVVGSPTNITQLVTAVSYAPGTSYAWVTDDRFAYLTLNNGGLWYIQSTWPIDGSITHISMVDTSTGWMVSSFGEVLRYRGQVVSSRTPNPPFPEVYALDQNYPNPFNPSTSIQFRVPRRSSVKLTIYNVLGQLVTVLVDKEYQAGTYTQKWTGGVASGIYFYRLEATALDNGGGKYVEVKKMVLIK